MTRNNGPSFGPTSLAQFASLKKTRPWKSKAALVVGIGVPLGLLALNDPVAADPYGSPYDGDSHQDSGGSNSGSSNGDTGEDNNGEGTNKGAIVTATAGPVSAPVPQSDGITQPGFQITAQPAAPAPNLVETRYGNGQNDEDNNDGFQLVGDPNDATQEIPLQPPEDGIWELDEDGNLVPAIIDIILGGDLSGAQLAAADLPIGSGGGALGDTGGNRTSVPQPPKPPPSPELIELFQDALRRAS